MPVCVTENVSVTCGPASCRSFSQPPTYAPASGPNQATAQPPFLLGLRVSRQSLVRYGGIVGVYPSNLLRHARM